MQSGMGLTGRGFIPPRSTTTPGSTAGPGTPGRGRFTGGGGSSSATNNTRRSASGRGSTAASLRGAANRQAALRRLGRAAAAVGAVDPLLPPPGPMIPPAGTMVPGGPELNISIRQLMGQNAGGTARAALRGIGALGTAAGVAGAAVAGYSAAVRGAGPAETIATGLGSGLGAIGGGAVGGVLGAVGGPVGGAIGAIGGAAAGGALGGGALGAIGGAIDAALGGASRADPRYPGSFPGSSSTGLGGDLYPLGPGRRPAPLPGSGSAGGTLDPPLPSPGPGLPPPGQQEGAIYDVSGRSVTRTPEGKITREERWGLLGIVGPIKGLLRENREWFLIAAKPTDKSRIAGDPVPDFKDLSIDTIVRTDGQPDTGPYTPIPAPPRGPEYPPYYTPEPPPTPRPTGAPTPTPTPAPEPTPYRRTPVAPAPPVPSTPPEYGIPPYVIPFLGGAAAGALAGTVIPNLGANAVPGVGTGTSTSAGSSSGGGSGGPTTGRACAGNACGAALSSGQRAANQKLDTILDRIGPKVGAGGIGGHLKRAYSFLQLDRVLNLLTLAATVHNAYFLSSALTQTLFSMVSNVLSVAGFNDNDGNPIDIGDKIAKQVDAILKSMLGVENVDGMKATWKTYSRIYQAATNILFSIQSISYSILGALEIVGGYVAKIGNALKRWGEVSERAYQWMNPSPNFQHPFFRRVEQAQEVTENIDSIASEILSIKDIGKQFAGQKKELVDSVAQTPLSGQATPTPEATKVAANAATAAAASQSPPITQADLVKPES